MCLVGCEMGTFSAFPGNLMFRLRVFWCLVAVLCWGVGCVFGEAVVRVGLLVPLNGTNCLQGLEAFYGALEYAKAVNAKSAVSAAGVRVEVVPLHASTSLLAWESTQAFLEAAPCGNLSSGGSCGVVHGALLGPPSSVAVSHLQFASLSFGVPLLSFGASAGFLSSGLGGDTRDPGDPLFLRFGWSDALVTAGLWDLILEFEWDQVSILYTETVSGRGALESLEARMEAHNLGAERRRRGWAATERSARIVSVANVVSFPSLDLGEVGKSGDGGGDGGDGGGEDVRREELGRRRRKMKEALAVLQRGEGRVTVLLAGEADAVEVMREAKKLEMTGKGWTWVGGPWVREAVWQRHGASGLLEALEGVVGAVPHDPRSKVRSVEIGGPLAVAGGSAVSTLAGGAFQAPSVDACPAAVAAGCSDATACSLSPDVLVPFVEDAIEAVAAAAVDMRSESSSLDGCKKGTKVRRICPRGLEVRMRRGWRSSEARNGGFQRVAFSSAGDRVGVPMRVVNIRPGGEHDEVAEWKSKQLPSHCRATAKEAKWNDDEADDPDAARGWDGCDLGEGEWEWTGVVVWPGGTTAIPPDRIVLPELTAALVVFAMLSGIALSTALGHWLHSRPHISRWIPESGATILLGVLMGILLRATGDRAVDEAAGFDETLFALALLPVIIFESGFALDKHPFFSQLGSILTFAVFGTLIATMFVGLILFGLSDAGAMATRLSFEEAMSFAALICAVDPVATLAVFGSLNVDPRLNALVYGEAVINDAVAIVLFRTFSRFLTVVATPHEVGASVGQFIGIFFGSAMIGVAMAWLTTVFFKILRPAFGGGSRPQGIVGVRPDEINPSSSSSSTSTATRRAGGGSGPIMTESLDSSEVSVSMHLPGSDAYEQAPTGNTKPSRRPCWGFGCHVSDAHGIAQTTFLLLMGYASFSLAEGSQMSGIVASLASGIAMNHYTRRALSPSGRRLAQWTFKLLAQVAETAVFFSVGVNVVLFFGAVDMGFTFITVVLCLVARAIGVFPLAWLLNRGRKHPIPMEHQVIQWHSGLRGAIAYATSLVFPSQHREEIINTTAWTIFITIFLLGGTTQPLMSYLGIRTNTSGTAIDSEPEDTTVPGAEEETAAGADGSDVIDDVSAPGDDEPSTPSTALAAREQRRALTREAQRESMIKAWVAWIDRTFTRPALYVALDPEEAIAAATEERMWRDFEEGAARRIHGDLHGNEAEEDEGLGEPRRRQSATTPPSFRPTAPTE